MRWLDGIAGSMEMTLSKLQLGMNREDWRAIVHGVAELDMVSNRTELIHE